MGVPLLFLGTKNDLGLTIMKPLPGEMLTRLADFPRDTKAEWKLASAFVILGTI